jgi:hypothetical protein
MLANKYNHNNYTSKINSLRQKKFIIHPSIIIFLFSRLILVTKKRTTQIILYLGKNNSNQQSGNRATKHDLHNYVNAN